MDYDLGHTLDSGQAFRWKLNGNAWTSVIGNRWVRLRQEAEGILAETTLPCTQWDWLENYLQLEVDIHRIMQELPQHPALSRAIAQHHGLRLLRQDPWECLASFILSSTKQIAHIKQIVANFSEQYGEPVATPENEPAAHAFPTANCVAGLKESNLRLLRMGFRAPYVLKAAEAVASGQVLLEQLKTVSLPDARKALMSLPGVGRKIADCVLLFALGFDEAFPVDVWVMRALQSEWFPGQSMRLKELVSFSESQFGRYGGYAQQYLFHKVRTESKRFRLIRTNEKPS